jgi:RHS repeat-associated protein
LSDQDQQEATAPNQVLSLDPSGAFILTAYNPDGTVASTKSLTPSDALFWIDSEIASHTATNVPMAVEGKDGATVVGTVSQSDLKTWLGIAIAELAKEHAGDAEGFALAMRANVIDPQTIRLVTQLLDTNQDTLTTIWPDLSAVLAGPSADLDPDVGETAAPDGSVAGSPNVMEGTRAQGPGPLPVSPPAPVGGDGFGTMDTGAPGAAAPGGGAVADASRAGDPVLGATGQLSLEVVDLELTGVGLNVVFARSYLHNTRYEGPLGPGWDHSYNLWLREAIEPQPDGSFRHVVYRSTGCLQQSRFVAVDVYDDDPGDPSGIADAVFRGDNGDFDRLIKESGSFRCTSPDGKQVFYNTDLYAERLVDRNGNTVRLVYAPDPIRLAAIEDTCGRELLLAYDDAFRLVGLEDRSIRRFIAYGYDDQGRLESSWRSIQERDPLPKLVQGYRYWDDGPEGLTGNIVGILDGRGIEVLQIAYGDEEGLVSYNRVVEQRDGGVNTFDYTYVLSVAPDDDPFGDVMVRLDMTTADGVDHVLEYNRQGRIVRHALALDAPARWLETRWRYNADGQIVRETRPDGGVTEYVLEREIFEQTSNPQDATPDEWSRFGFLRRVVEHAVPGARGAPQRVTEFDRDPVFGFVVERRGPYYADATGQPMPGQLVAKLQCDYDAAGNLVAIVYPDATQADGSIQTDRRIDVGVDSRGRTTACSIALEDGSSLVTTFDFDPNGAGPRAQTSDAAGLALRRTFSYDAAGRLLRIVDEGAGIEASYAYDHAGRLLTQEEQDRNAGAAVPSRRTHTWADHDLPVQSTWNRVLPDGREDPAALLVEDFTFDREGNVASCHTHSQDGTVSTTVTFERGPDQRLVRIESDGIRTTASYDPRGLAVRIERAAPGVESTWTECAYDDAGRIARLTDVTGRVERLSYDGFGRVARRVHADGTTEEHEWGADDQLLHSVVSGKHPDQRSPVRLYEEWRTYDVSGRVKTTEVAVFDPARRPRRPPRAGTSFHYDRADRVVAVRAADGVTSRFGYDGMGRIVTFDDGSGTTAMSRFHDAQRTVEHAVVVSGEDLAGTMRTLRFTSRLRLDWNGAVAEAVDGLGNATTWEHDSRGSLTAVRGADGVEHRYESRPDGALLAETLAPGSPVELTWRYRRDAVGRLTALEGPFGTAATIQRDGFGRPTAVACGPDLARNVQRLAYDAAGRIGRTLDARGVATLYDYDAASRLGKVTLDTSAVDPSQETVAPTAGPTTYTYDGAGQLVRADNGVRPVDRRFDSCGRLIRETTAAGTVSWEYDLLGRPSGVTHPSGRRLAFERARDGRIVRITTTPRGGRTADEILRVGAASAAGFAPQLWRGRLARTEARDGAGRLLGISDTEAASGASLSIVTQVCDARGVPHARQSELDGTVETLAYDTDARRRLIGVAYAPVAALVTTGLAVGSSGVQRDHDAAAAAAVRAIGRRPPLREAIVLTASGPRRTYERRDHGRLVETRSYDSDTSGRVVRTGMLRRDDPAGLPTRSGRLALAYDGVSRPSAVSRGRDRLLRIERDALGRAVRVVEGRRAVRIVYDGWNAVEYRVERGASFSLLLEPETGGLVEIVSPSGARRPLYDLDGSLVALADERGRISARVAWSPWGEVRSRRGTWPLPWREYHGMRRLDGLALFLTPYRLYDPMTGAFLEPDPLFFVDGLDRHAFARGNPAVFTDPTGLMAVHGSATGNPGSSGEGGGLYGTWRVETWWQRGLAAMAGALWSLGSMVLETAKQVVDLVGMSVSVLGTWSGLWNLDYRVMSGIGTMVERGNLGTGDTLWALLKGAFLSPLRAYQAAQDGDCFRFGSEAMNMALLLESPVRGIARRGYNVGVRALGRSGSAWGKQKWLNIRAKQIVKMEAAAMTIVRRGLKAAGRGEAVTPKFKFNPAAAAADEGTGSFRPDPLLPQGHAFITEAAFTPGWRQIFLPMRLGGGVLSRLHLRLNNVLAGNLALRSMVHEAWHQQQFTAMGRSAWDGASSEFRPYAERWIEFTQPTPSGAAPDLEGAWNFELNVPAGGFSRFVLGALDLGATSAKSEGRR